MKFPTTYSIETARCRLRFVSKDDIPHIFAATRYAGFNDGMLWDPPAHEEELIPPYEENVRAWREDRSYCFTIEAKQSRTFIGRISIRLKEDSRWDIGFWTHPKEQNKGYMKEAVVAIIRFGFEELSATGIVACHATWNRASEAVLTGAGLKFLEYLPRGFEKKGKWVPENLRGITRKDWESTQEP